MLAYELYLENKNTGQDFGKGIPIKKITVDSKGKIEIDDIPIEKYDKMETSNNQINFIQKNFNMPIDTINDLNLPKKIVASNAKTPYVTIFGSIKIKTKNNTKYGTIILGNEKKGYSAKLFIPEYKKEIVSADISFRPDKKNYLLDGTPLYDAYCENKILVNDAMPAKLFSKISIKFFEYVQQKQINIPAGKSNFILYILPNDSPITYNQVTESQETTQVDSFGNDFSTYSKSRTAGVFFLSFDDKAFTINCKQYQEFYKTLGIGKETLQNIILPSNKMMKIPPYDWYFINLDDSHYRFENKPVGIYAQLYNIFKSMSYKGVDTKSKLLTFCIKKTKSKFEVMISENLSMPKLAKIFENVTYADIPLLAFEELIITRYKNTTYRYYMYAIKSLLNQTSFDGNTLNKIFIEIIHNNINKWLDKNAKAEIFFIRSEFCKERLKISAKHIISMEQSEFAKKVGLMTRIYIDFRKDQHAENNSFKTILTKPKYDIKTLQDVIKQIGRSIHLLKLNEKDYENILDKITAVTPSDVEEPDLKADLSYHFYLGYFGKQSS